MVYILRPYKGTWNWGNSSSGDPPAAPATLRTIVRHALQVQIVMEYCELGSLHAWLRCEAFLAKEGMDYDALLETAADIAKGMAHLHSLNILHSDLKVGTCMVKGDQLHAHRRVVKDIGNGRVSKPCEGTQS